ncbi:helix-turn-helix domain-containing protein [Actinoplanes sp. CA-142083]|uniref:helix-turn-helix domain-containing protein n=1 Tax=Actinoplanes sp. CA-142083 TaxID=3239903 RepID=UPI003D94C8F8
MDDSGFFGDVLRRLCDERGLSVRELAKLTNHSKTVIGEWRTGAKVPDPVEAERVDALLGAGGILAAAARMPGANGSAERLAYVAAAPRTVDTAAVDALAATLASMRRLEDSIGAERLIVVTAEPLRLVDELADEARGAIRERVVDVAGQWEQFAGWLQAASGRGPAARARYARTLEHATEARDDNLIATSLSMRGHLAWTARQPGPVIGLSAAAAGHALSPGLRAMAAQQEARGHALLGEAGDVERLFDAADEQMAAAAAHPEGEPPWTYFYTPGYLRMQRGLAYGLLGRNDDAIGELRAGLAEAGPLVAGSEFGANYKLRLAEAHLQAGDRDVAEGLIAEVRVLAASTGSASLAHEAERLERQAGS